MAKGQTTEDQVKNFYETAGWKADSDGNSKDAQLWEDLRPCASDYLSFCRRKILDLLPHTGKKILDAASGPIQYPEYLEYSKNFETRYCVDISSSALQQAEKKLGTKGKYFQASLLDLPFEADYFDASLSLHTIYHIHKDEQEKAVRELIRVTKPGCPLVVIYANPHRPSLLIKNILKGNRAVESPIYYYAHPLAWWNRFSPLCEVEIFSWRMVTAPMSKRMIPAGGFGKKMFQLLEKFEENFPRASAPLAAYPMILLKKKN